MNKRDWLKGPSGTRRTFLAQAGLAAGGVVALGAAGGGEAAAQDCQVQPPPAMGTQQRAPAYAFPRLAPTRVRKSLREVVETKTELERLTKAYAALKKLPSQLPNSWCNLANIHDKHCSYGPGDRPAGQPAYYTQVHLGWLFLPWHRAFLYLVETVLGNLVGDPTFALPYWDWTNDLVVPDVFFDKDSPLYHEPRAIQKGQWIADDRPTREVTGPGSLDAIRSIPAFFPRIPGFGASFGGPPDTDQLSSFLQGALEAGPHNAIHNWVGGDMGSFDTAARDFLFFCHHSNVDKVWADWLLIPGHTNPSSPGWSGQWFNFPDPTDPAAANAPDVSVTAADTVDFTRVNVLYQPYRPPQARALAARLAAQPATDLAQPRTVKASVPVVPMAAAMVAGPPRRRILLVLEGLEDPGDVDLRLHAFLNKDDATAETSLTDPSYVGTFFVIPMHRKANGHRMKMGKPHTQPPRTLSLDITDRAAALLQGPPPTVTLVPANRNDKSKAAPEVKFRSVSVVTEN